jgi:hypothetical protein
MDLSVIAKGSRQLGKALNHNSPTILTALGVAGLLTTVILAVKATPKALEVLSYEKGFRESEPQDADYLKPISVVDAVELTWKLYVPTILMGSATIACMIGANSIHLRRNAALVSLFSITETTLREYQEKVKEQIGEKKEEKIRAEIAQDKLTRNPVDDRAIILTGKGEYLCFDEFSGRYFQSDIEKIRQAVNEFNHKLLREGWFTLNEFYYLVGLDQIPTGNELGWEAMRDMLEINTYTKQATNGEPCLVIEYRVQPRHV